MNPPTKFQKMRCGRTRLEIAAERQAGVYYVPPSPPPAPAVPTMEIDGVRYREAPLPNPSFNGCDGCVFQFKSVGCGPAWRAGKEAFGGPCEERRVIYLRAD